MIWNMGKLTFWRNKWFRNCSSPSETTTLSPDRTLSKRSCFLYLVNSACGEAAFLSQWTKLDALMYWSSDAVLTLMSDPALDKTDPGCTDPVRVPCNITDFMSSLFSLSHLFCVIISLSVICRGFWIAWACMKVWLIDFWCPVWLFCPSHLDNWG